jgi:hypothetical protein
MNNGERIIAIPKANPVNSYTIIEIVKDIDSLLRNSRSFYNIGREKVLDRFIFP